MEGPPLLDSLTAAGVRGDCKLWGWAWEWLSAEDVERGSASGGDMEIESEEAMWENFQRQTDRQTDRQTERNPRRRRRRRRRREEEEENPPWFVLCRLNPRLP